MAQQPNSSPIASVIEPDCAGQTQPRISLVSTQIGILNRRRTFPLETQCLNPLRMALED
jgi:hypothetical protein